MGGNGVKGLKGSRDQGAKEKGYGNEFEKNKKITPACFPLCFIIASLLYVGSRVGF